MLDNSGLMTEARRFLINLRMEGHWGETSALVLITANLLTPDRMQLAWITELMNGRAPARVARMELMMALG